MKPLGPSKERYQKYFEGRALGLPPVQAAKFAGVSDTKCSAFLANLNKSEWGTREEAKITAMLSAQQAMSKEKVQALVLEAIDMAKVLADPTGMLRGAQELNKMHGYYAEEKKTVNIHADVVHAQRELERMPATALLQALGEELDPLEAEFERLGESGTA